MWRVVDPLDRLVREVELVLDLADDLLEQVLERDDALHRAVLVDDDGHVLVLLPELGQERCQVLRLGDDVDGPQKLLDLDLSDPAVVQRREEVADVQDPDDLVERVRGRRDSACTATRAARRALPRRAASIEIATTWGRGTITSWTSLSAKSKTL